MNTCITLIGLPASGKSTLGKLLAEALHMGFTDTDDLLANHKNLTLEEILQQEGHTGFQKAEEEAVISFTPKAPTVIATGGSVVYSAGSMEHLQKLGPVVYIHLSEEAAMERLKKAPSRAIVMEEDDTLENLIHTRHTLYSHYATHILPASTHGSPQESLTALLKLLSHNPL